MGNWCLAAAFWCVAGLAAAQDAAGTPYALYYADVVRVIDGDTLDVRVDLWPGV